MTNYKVKENHRLGKSINVQLVQDGKVVYDRYVDYDTWMLDPEEVAAAIVAYWDECVSKPVETATTPETPVEVSLTSENAITKNIAVARKKAEKDAPAGKEI